MSLLSLQTLRHFYIATVGLIFVVCLVLQIPRLNVPTYMKTLTFVLWAAFGIIPTAHWAVIMGGFENAMVRVSRVHKKNHYFSIKCTSH